MEHAAQVGPYDVVPLLGRGHLDRHPGRDPRIGQEDVDATELGHRLVSHRLDLSQIALLGQRVPDRGQILASVQEDDVGAFAG